MHYSKNKVKKNSQRILKELAEGPYEIDDGNKGELQEHTFHARDLLGVNEDMVAVTMAAVTVICHSKRNCVSATHANFVM